MLGICNASERGHVQVLYYWMDLNLRRRSQSSLDQVLVLKNSKLYILNCYYNAVNHTII